MFGKGQVAQRNASKPRSESRIKGEEGLIKQPFGPWKPHAEAATPLALYDFVLGKTNRKKRQAEVVKRKEKKKGLDVH